MSVCVGCGLRSTGNFIEADVDPMRGIDCDSEGLFTNFGEMAGQGYVNATESTSSMTYTDLATVGPTVSIVTGTKAFVTFGAYHYDTFANPGASMSVAVTGATTIPATDNYSLYNPFEDPFALTITTVITGLNPGTNIFTAKYRATGSGAPANFQSRRLIVVPA